MSTVEERQRARDRAADAVARTDEVRVKRTRELPEGWPSKLVGSRTAAYKRKLRAAQRAAKARTESGDSDPQSNQRNER